MTSLVHSIRRRTLVVGLTVASLAGASGAFASLESGSDYAAPEIIQLGYGPGGPGGPAGGRTVAGASLESGFDYAAPELIQLGYGPGGPAGIPTLAELSK